MGEMFKSLLIQCLSLKTFVMLKKTKKKEETGSGNLNESGSSESFDNRTKLLLLF